MINTEADFHTWAALTNDPEHPEHGGAAYYRLTADLRLSEPFTMIDEFGGTFDGAGHTISGLRIDGNIHSDDAVAMIGRNTGVIENLVLSGAEITMSGSKGPVTGAIAATLVGRNTAAGLVQSVEVSGSVEAPGAEKGAGFVGENLGGTIQDCSFEGSVRSNLMASGVAAYNNANGLIQRCLVSAELETVSTSNVEGRTDQRGNDAAFVVAYSNTATVRQNVVYDGSLTYAYPGATAGFYGRVSGYDGYSRTLSDNLANQAVTING